MKKRQNKFRGASALQVVVSAALISVSVITLVLATPPAARITPPSKIAPSAAKGQQ